MTDQERHEVVLRGGPRDGALLRLQALTPEIKAMTWESLFPHEPGKPRPIYAVYTRTTTVTGNGRRVYEFDRTIPSE